MKRKKANPETFSGILREAGKVVWAGKKSIKQFFTNVEHAIEFLGESIDITTHDIGRYRAHLIATGYSMSTVNQKLVNVSTLLKYAHEAGWVEQVPKFTITKIEDNERGRLLSETEQAKLLQWFNDQGQPEMAAFIELLILTGCRCNELLLARKVQVEGNFLRLSKTKTGKIRRVPLVPRAKELADAFIPFSLKYKQCYDLWGKAGDALGFTADNSEDEEGLVMHCLRHTAATRLLQRSGSLKAVKELLGHKNFKTTERYAKYDHNDLMSAMMK